MLISKLENNDILFNNLLEYESQAKSHYNDDFRKQRGSLREIKTFYLATVGDVEKSKFTAPYRHSAINLLQDVVSKLNKTVDDIHYAYYAIIPPNKQIYQHADVEQYYRKINRYQIFFNLTDDQKIIQSGNVSESDSLVLFNTLKPHGFINKSSIMPWYFIVFDIYKDVI
jgi:hypothetical protein